jgi:hypothetical protein
MAELKQSARQKTTTMIIIGLIIVFVVGVGALLLSPNSPLRPKASELPAQTATTFAAPQQAEFRNGQVGSINGDKVSVDEANGGSFSFTMTDATIIRGLKDNKFEIVDRDRLDKGDFVSVFYQNTDTAQRISRIDIIKEK